MAQDDRDQRNKPEFRETLGGVQAMPADVASATYITIWLALAVVAVVLFAMIITNLVSGRGAAVNSNVPAGTLLPLSGTLYTSRATTARAIANPTDTSPNTGAVSGMSSGYGDGYALQGSAGTAGARHVEPSSDLAK